MLLSGSDNLKAANVLPVESGTEVVSTKGLLGVSGSEDCLSPKLKVLLGTSEVVVEPPNTV